MRERAPCGPWWIYQIELVATTATAATTTTTAATAAAAAARSTAATTAARSTAATAVAAAAAAATVATATAAAARTVTALLGLVDAQRATVEHLAVHLLDGLLGRLAGRHGDESKAARAAGLAVEHELDLDELAELLERLAEDVLGGVKREIADVKTIIGAHWLCFPRVRLATLGAPLNLSFKEPGLRAKV
jgi:hypothetical protein